MPKNSLVFFKKKKWNDHQEYNTCTRFIPGTRFFISLISVTFLLLSNLVSLTVNAVLTDFSGLGSSSSSFKNILKFRRI